MKKTLLVVGSIVLSLSQSQATVRQKFRLSATTSSTLVELMSGVPATGPERGARSAYSCVIDYERPELSEGVITGEKSTVLCTSRARRQPRFEYRLNNDAIRAHGDRFQKVKFEFVGEFQTKLQAALFAAIRSSQASGASRNFRYDSGLVCDPAMAYCTESFYLSDGPNPETSSSSFICIREAERVSDRAAPVDRPLEEWVDEQILQGQFKVISERCVFTGI